MTRRLLVPAFALVVALLLAMTSPPTHAAAPPGVAIAAAAALEGDLVQEQLFVPELGATAAQLREFRVTLHQVDLVPGPATDPQDQAPNYESTGLKDREASGGRSHSRRKRIRARHSSSSPLLAMQDPGAHATLQSPLRL